MQFMDKKRYDIITFHPRRHHNFEQAARLAKYFDSFKHLTGLYFSPASVKLISRFWQKAGRELSRRSYNFPRSGMVSHYPVLELSRLFRQKTGKKIDYEYYHNKFQDWVVRNYKPPRIALGFDSLSKRVFEAWKGKSFLVLDLVIGIPQYRAKLDANAEKITPELLSKRPENDQKLYRLYERELELADLILCGSDFVKHTCLDFGIAPEKLKVVNYGVDVERFKNPNKEFKRGKENLKFIFAGAVGYRKGADILVQAWQLFSARNKGHELHFFGNVELDFPKNLENVFFHGQVNQLDLIEHMKSADALVFPSTFEGSAYSIYQSMAMKLAVITTPNSGTVLKNGKSAIIIEHGNPKKIAEAMEKLVENPQMRIELAEQAYLEAQKYTWDSYGKKLKAIFQEILDKRPE